MEELGELGASFIGRRRSVPIVPIQPEFAMAAEDIKGGREGG